MEPETNKEVARRFFALLTAGDVDAAASLLADEGDFWQAGWDGPGRTITLAEFAELFRSVIEAIPTGIVFTVGDVLAEGDWVVAQVSCLATLASGKVYQNRYCFVLEIVGGKVVSGKEYMDTMHAASIFAPAQ